MNILMVHNDYARPSGEEHAAQALAALLAARGHGVGWLSRSSAELSGLRAKAGSFFSGIFSPRARAEMARRLEREPFDLVQAQNLYPLFSPSIFKPCRERGIPVVMRCPNYRLFCPSGLHLVRGRVCERCLEPGREAWCVLNNCEGSLAKSLGYAARGAAARLARLIVDNVAVFIVLSEFQRRRFIAGGLDPARVEVVPNYDPDEAAAGALADAAGTTISFAGRLSPEKGIADFLAAARALPKLEFAVAGDASRAPELVRAAPPNVRFHGFLAGPALLEFYRRTAVFVFPGRWFEGFPNVVTRAMTAARPVIASRIGALPEIVEDGATGLLYKPGDVNELVERIRRLAADPAQARALGQAGRARALERYGAETVYGRLMDVYRKARELGAPPRRGRLAGI